MGADIELTPHGADAAEPTADIHVRASALHGIEVPQALVALAIDEFPVFFIAAAAAQGQTTVTGAAELRVKESDRLAVMASGLGALGIECQLLADGLAIQGGEMSGGRIDSHGDHRIAMAFAVASLVASAPIEIADVANVATSFPGFPQLARAVGLDITDVLERGP
jgi:3-phosphoshikimate 1-carboxyvinyltransferase